MKEPPAHPAEPGPADAPRFCFGDAVWILVVVGLAVGSIAGGWWLAGRGGATASPVIEARSMAAFTLRERSGRTVTHAEFAGRFVVVNFMYTSCSVSCLVVNEHMAEIQRLVAGQPDVLLLSITLDPRTDTPAVLTKFADRFSADTNRWLFLTGEKAAVYSLLEASFLPRDAGSPAPGGFSGMERIILVDPAGRSRASFNGLREDAPAAVLSWIADLRRREKKP